jgi:ADP-heptose:LPS heptosyltransferase
MIVSILKSRHPIGTRRSGLLSRALDFHVGRTLLWIIGRSRGIFRRSIAEPTNIGLCVLGAIGDVVLCSSLIADLKQHHVRARVIIVVSRSNASIIPLLANIDGSLVLPLFSPLKAITQLRREHFDLLIDANQWLRISALYCALAGAKRTIGFSTPGQHRHYAFDFVVEHDSTKHEIENYRNLVGPIGITAKSEPWLKTSPEDETAIRGLLRAPHVILHPWAGGGQAALKEWPTQNWIGLAKEMAARGYTIVVTGGPGDKSKADILVEAARRLDVSIITAAGRLSLGQTACLLKSAALVVSVNTGVMHLAAAFGVPLVALHGPTNPKRWGPIGRNAISIVPTLAPADVPVGYLNLGFEFPPNAPHCMMFIPVEAVVNAITTIITPVSSKADVAAHSSNHDVAIAGTFTAGLMPLGSAPARGENVTKGRFRGHAGGHYYVALLALIVSSVVATDISVSHSDERKFRPHMSNPTAVLAVSSNMFLSSLGVNTHVDQGNDPALYVMPLRYTGIRNIRDGLRNVAGYTMLHKQTGVHVDLGGADLTGLIAAAKTLAAANGLLSVEGPNEPNNFPIIHEGQRGGGSLSWAPVAEFQKALYGEVKSIPILNKYPVFHASEGGAETDNVGLQFLTIPENSEAVFPEGTRYADYANVHNYVSGTNGQYGDNQAWLAADPTLNTRWDGLYAEYGRTWGKGYRGYSLAQLETLPRVTTETGWDTKVNPGGERIQGVVMVNTYLAQFKRGWRYTFIYELRDNEGGEGSQGLYHVDFTPKLAATYIHNLTSILADGSPVGGPGRLKYSVVDEPATVHDMLLQKRSGAFELVVWGEQVTGFNHVTVDLGELHPRVKIYDVTTGTKPIRTLTRVSSIMLEVSDHAIILEID